MADDLKGDKTRNIDCDLLRCAGTTNSHSLSRRHIKIKQRIYFLRNADYSCPELYLSHYISLLLYLTFPDHLRLQSFLHNMFYLILMTFRVFSSKIRPIGPAASDLEMYETLQGKPTKKVKFWTLIIYSAFL